MKIPFHDSSDDDEMYQVIEEPKPQIPERVNPSNVKTNSSELDERKMSGSVHAPLRCKRDVMPLPYKHIKLREMVKAKNVSEIGRKKNNTIEKGDLLQSYLPSIPKDKNITHDKKYTQLEFSKPPRVYEPLNVHGDSLPLEISKNIPEKEKKYLGVWQKKKVLEDNQTEEDFYKYSVKEVSFCFEHCGIKKLADMCYDRKLDGSFFKGFSDWKDLNLSNLDAIKIKKMIIEGWRSKDDST